LAFAARLAEPACEKIFDRVNGRGRIDFSIVPMAPHALLRASNNSLQKFTTRKKSLFHRAYLHCAKLRENNFVDE